MGGEGARRRRPEGRERKEGARRNAGGPRERDASSIVHRGPRVLVDGDVDPGSSRCPCLGGSVIVGDRCRSRLVPAATGIRTGPHPTATEPRFSGATAHQRTQDGGPGGTGGRASGAGLVPAGPTWRAGGW